MQIHQLPFPDVSSCASKVNEQRDNRNDVFSITNVEFDDESKANENLSDTAKDEVTEQLNKLTLRQRTAAQANADRTVPEMLKENEKDESATNTEKRASKKRTEKRPIDRNPLHWFGILVPASLRTCQQHFKNGNYNCSNPMLNMTLN